MNVYTRVQIFQVEKLISLSAVIGLALKGVFIAFVLILSPYIVHADGILPADYPDAQLINEGRDLFFNETFDGNGRTCGTCHPEDNNYTLDAEFIADLPDDDPLFVAERAQPNPLSEHFEKPELMRKLGLIMENTNGFDNGFTMRSVPHLRALRSSVTPPSEMAYDGTDNPPDERTGWSGDGSPVDEASGLRGTLRQFTVGAIKQHFTKSLNREAGVDFRLASEHELDAIDAFMLSLGRQEAAKDIHSYSMLNEKAERGRLNYMGVGLASGVPCNACHFNGGANTDPNFDFPPGITPAAFEKTNRSFAPRVEELLDQPGDVLVEGELPFDDGFGSGTNLFNVPPVIEAADSGPFFHSNQIDTIEAMISFYTSQRVLRNGEILPAIVGLNGAQVANVGAFIRVLNAVENARAAISLINQAKGVATKKDKRANLHIAKSEIKDAIEVLQGGKIHFADAVPFFKSALHKIHAGKLSKAIIKIQKARDAMIRYN